MLLPLKDRLFGLRLPWITLILVTINVAVWGLGLTSAQTSLSGQVAGVNKHDVWVWEYGAIPCELTGRCENQAGRVILEGGFLDPRPTTGVIQVDSHSAPLTLLTAAFLHGGLIHLVFNMMFLLVYGRAIELSMHPLAYIGFYLTAGILSGLAQVATTPGASAPIIGASGAVAGVIGAYLVLYPRVKMLTILVVPIVLWLPAWIVAGAWGALQFLAYWQSLFAPTALDGTTAYAAHVGGFAFGILAVRHYVGNRTPLLAHHES